MGLKKGDIIDEFKRYPESCGLIVKVMSGGEGFQKIVCCGHDLTAEDVVPVPLKKHGRRKGQKGVGFIIDERKSYPDACGLRLMIVDGGQGLQHMECCGHRLTLADEKRLLDLGFGKVRKDDEEEKEEELPGGPIGTA
jgi:Desulfoferrodoxin, N-terminal domain